MTKKFKLPFRSPKINKETMEKFDGDGHEVSKKRELQGAWKHTLWIVGLMMGVVHIYFLAIRPVNPWILYCFHFAFGFSILIATRKATKKAPDSYIPFYDIIIILIIILIAIYIGTNIEGVVARSGVNPTNIERVLFLILTIIILEIARRTIGMVLPMIAIIVLLYARFGNLLPASIGHRGYTWKKIFSFLVSTEAIFSTPFNASATMVVMFIIFGAFLQACGSGQYFIDLSIAMAGGSRGGPAKVAVLSSALFGSVSGNSVANVVSTGTLTIPLMKSIGYSPVFAGAAEAVASTGGQFMPPVLGSAAFIMAQIIGVSYSRIILASLIPAILYFYTVYLIIDLQAIKHGLLGMPKSELPLKAKVFKKIYYVLPILVLILVLSILKWSPVRSALTGILVCIIVSWIDKSNRIGFKEMFNALSRGSLNAASILAACSTAGIVIGVLNLTGGGLRLAGFIVDIAQGFLPAALFLTMIASLIMGMGLPTSAAYLICAAVVVPTLIRLEVPMLSAHMFIFYYACISAFTPPVCTASYAAAGIANAPPMKVAFTACKLGITAFIIPYMFIYGPSLLWEGGALTIVATLFTALVGCTFLAFGMQKRIFYLKCTILECITLILSAGLLIFPGLKTDIFGIVISVIVIGLAFIRNKRTQSGDTNLSSI